MTKAPKLLRDGLHKDGVYVKAWKEGRGHGEFIVQVWRAKEPIGEPDGDWAMPGILGLQVCIDQAVAQTR